MGFVLLVLFEIFALVALLLGGLPDGAAWVAYFCLAVLTAPVWGLAFVLLVFWVDDVRRNRAREKRRLAKQIEREKLARLLNAG
ncbi:hypothetical protein [Aeromonas caviae]|uniref:hypothetical protein n=1 Tax=Aeromonas caviae TaxID=648 RepID=UPI002B4A969C|nr:hypothetical protein [Aeromonas caviae]